MVKTAKAKKRHKKVDKLYQRRRMQDINHKLIRNLRHSTRKVMNIQGSKLKLDIIKYLGCSIDEFKEYLEHLFYGAMSWRNYGGREGWQLDHIEPLSSFDLTEMEQLKTVCFFSNIQPLFKWDNQSKGDCDEWIHPEEAVPF